MRFAPLPFDAALDDTGSRLERWELFSLTPRIDLGDDAAVRAAADALVDAELPDAPPPQTPPRAWVSLSRVEARRVMLWALRFSMAYGGPSTVNVPAFAAVARFFDLFGPEARILSPLDGLGALLDDEGRPPRGAWGYGSTFALTRATFEATLIVVDWERAGLFVATDED